MKAGEERTQIAKGIHSESKQPEEIILLSGWCSDSLNVSLSAKLLPGVWLSVVPCSVPYLRPRTDS